MWWHIPLISEGTSRWFMWITDKFCLHNELWASYIRRTHLKETWREGDRENTPFSNHSTVWMVGESPFSKFLEFFLVSQQHMWEKFQGGGGEVVGQAWEEHISGATATLPAREDGRLTCMLGTKQECRLWPSIVIFGITEVTLGKQWAAMDESITKPLMWYSADRQPRDWGMRHHPPSSLSETI